MATVKTCLMAACCGLVLLGAVSAHAGLSTNGLCTSVVQSEGLPFHSLSHSGLGKQ